MKLSNKQHKKLRKALIDAFPNKFLLEQMLFNSLGKNLDAIAGGANLEEIVFNLVKVAIARGWIQDLITSAYEENPENLSLQAIREEIVIINTTILSNSRKTLLDTIRGTVLPVLDSYFPDGKQINLLKQLKPHLMRPKNMAYIPSNRNNPYPACEQNIIEVFWKHSGRLLILGEHGSGKTTTLLELTKYFVDKASNDSNVPIPVILSLSSWDNQNMEKWLVNQLVDSYSLNDESAFNLLKNRQILPLLDDLGQLDISRQYKCVKAINDFLSMTQPLIDYLVVCSTEGGYKNNPQLKLNGAIYLHPLTKVQINHYLVAIGHSKLWEIIQDKNHILELIENPLFLFMMLNIPEKESIIEIWTRFPNDKGILFDYYITRLETRLEDYPQITSRKAKIWLKNLAIKFKNESSNYLLIEKIQPNDWLITNNKKYIYHIIVGLVIGIIIFLFLLIYIFFCKFIYSLVDNPLWIILSIITSIPIGVITSSLNAEIKPVETIKIPWIEIVDAVRLAGLKDRIIGALISSISNITNINSEKIYNLISVIWSLGKGIVGFVIPLNVMFDKFLRNLRGIELQIEERTIVNQGIKNSAKNGLFIALISGFLLGLFMGLFGLIGNFGSSGNIQEADKFLPIHLALVGGLVGVLFGGLFGGILACIQHFTLRLIIAFQGDMPWHYIRFLNYATKQRFLQRDGGCYRFIHPLLQKHFNKIDTR
jgi:hypothetical protein